MSADKKSGESPLKAQLESKADAQALLDSVLDSARGFAIIGTDHDGQVTLWSAGAERLFICPEKLICGPDGAAQLDRLSSPDCLPLREVFARAMDQGNHETDFEARTRGGRPFPANVAARPWLNPAGEVVGAIAIVQDLSLRVQTLRERDAALAEARSAREAALAAANAKAEFLANMSHEIRTPMNAVLGMLDLLLRTELADRQSDYVDKARKAAVALLNIIDDILDVSKVEAGKLRLDPRPFAIDELLRDVAVILGANIGDKFVEVLFDVDPDLPSDLIGDAHRLKQILINLAGNALKFTEQGEVVLAVRAVATEQHSVELEFAVRDTGIGMTPEQQSRLFQAFSQAEAGTTRRFGGTGLGLVISQRLIQLMDGELELESELGVGSCFRFRIPLELSAPGSGRRLPRETPAAMQNLRVLVVDDNAYAREIMAGIIDSLHWQVELAASGREALTLLQDEAAQGRRFDFTFIDWAMPEMDGWDTVREMQQKLERSVWPTVVMVTAHVSGAIEKQSLQDQVAAFLVKPVTASDLFDVVSSLMVSSESSQTGKAQAEPSQRLRGLHLLVVDDNESNQQIARELLAYEGAVVDVADGGQQALDCIQSRQGVFDAVLMDIQMPGMDGYTATRKIRSELNLADLPVIAMTANVMPADREAGFAAGMQDYVGKPYHVDTIVASLLKHTGREADPVVPQTAEPITAVPPAPPGFDFASALLRLGNNRGLYARQAELFADQAESRFEQIRGMLEQRELRDAARELHTLKGLAATLGASALSRELKQMEAAVRESSPVPKLLSSLQARKASLDEAAVTFRELAVVLRPAQTAAAAVPPLAAEEQRRRFATLTALLAESNMRALEEFEQLRLGLDSRWSAELAAIAASLENLDFPAAAQLLLKLQEQMK